MGKYSNEPHFLETQALIAVMHEDDEELERLLDEMLDGELKVLSEKAMNLVYEIVDVRTARNKGDKTSPQI